MGVRAEPVHCGITNDKLREFRIHPPWGRTAYDKYILFHQVLVRSAPDACKEKVSLFCFFRVISYGEYSRVAVTVGKHIKFSVMPHIPRAPACAPIFHRAGYGVCGFQEIFGLCSADPFEHFTNF